MGYRSIVLTALVASCGGKLHPGVAQRDQANTFQENVSCSGPDCCMKGDAEDDEDCVMPGVITVLTPDARSTARVHFVLQKHGGSAKYGLADERGEIVVPPVTRTVLALSSRYLLTTIGTVVGPG